MGAMRRARGYFSSVNNIFEEESLVESPRPPPSPPPSPPQPSPSRSRLRSRLVSDTASHEVESASWRHSIQGCVSRGGGHAASGSQSSLSTKASLTSPNHSPVPPSLKRPSPPQESPSSDGRCTVPLPGEPAPQVLWPATQPPKPIKNQSAVEHNEVDSAAKHQSPLSKVAAKVLWRSTPQLRPPTQDRSWSTADRSSTWRRQSSKQSEHAPGSQTAHHAPGSQTASSTLVATREALKGPSGAKAELAPPAMLTCSTAAEEPQIGDPVMRQPSFAMLRSLNGFELHTGSDGTQSTPNRSSTADRSESVAKLKRRILVPLQGSRTPAARTYNDISDDEELDDGMQPLQQPPSRGAGSGGRATNTGASGHASHSCRSLDGAYARRAGGVIAGPESLMMFAQRSSHTPIADGGRRDHCGSRPTSRTNIPSSSGQAWASSLLAYQNSDGGCQEVDSKTQLARCQGRACGKSASLLPRTPVQDRYKALDAVDDPWEHSDGSNSCDGDTSAGRAIEVTLASGERWHMRACSKAGSQSVQLLELRGSGADEGAGPSVAALAPGSRHGAAGGKSAATGSSVNHDADGGAGRSNGCTAGTRGKHKGDSIADKSEPPSKSSPSSSRIKFGSSSGHQGRFRAALSAGTLWRTTPFIS